MTRLLAEVHQYAIIVDEQKRVLWLKSTGGKEKLMFPGGTLEKGETLEQGLVREIGEETRLQVKVGALIHVDLLSNRDPPHIGLVYVCTHPTGKIALSQEHSLFKWMKIGEAAKEDVAHPSLLELARKAVEQVK